MQQPESLVHVRRFLPGFVDAVAYAAAPGFPAADAMLANFQYLKWRASVQVRPGSTAAIDANRESHILHIILCVL